MNPVITRTRTDVEALYRATRNPQVVDVPELTFMCIDGRGDPETSEAYATSIRALYSVAYRMKYALRAIDGPVLKVGPLEGLWWADDPAAFATGQRSHWQWTLMLRVPPSLSATLFETCREDVATKNDLPVARQLRLLTFEEGPAAQVLHVGPYDAEGPTIARLHDFIRDHGFTFDAPQLRHHEIYLGDPRRCPAERLRTILRQPYVAERVGSSPAVAGGR